MSVLKFKSNINCGGCLSKVRPALDEQQEILEWNVDLDHIDRILTVKVENMSSKEVENVVGKVGFKVDLIG